MEFLRVPRAEHDLGASLQLQRMARAQGAERKQVDFLLSEPVQSALTAAFREGAASSLPAERYFAEAKRNEGIRVCHVATAGRNLILRQFLRDRAQQVRPALDACNAAA